MAHPFRLLLLDLIVRRGTLTSAEAAEATGESTAGCSFHLRQLAKYGYIEPAPARDRRERPWKRVEGGERIPDGLGAESARAAAEVTKVILGRAYTETLEWLDRQRELPVEWQRGAVLDEELLYLTADELQRLSAAVVELLAEHRGRTSDPAARPAGSLPVRALAILFPAPEIDRVDQPET
ncbi:MAG: winged helix-turn-helix domain-containing protein [Gaiellaceae bacterium]